VPYPGARPATCWKQTEAKSQKDAGLQVQKAVLKHRSPDASRQTVFMDRAKRLECGAFHRRFRTGGNDLSSLR